MLNLGEIKPDGLIWRPFSQIIIPALPLPGISEELEVVVGQGNNEDESLLRFRFAAGGTVAYSACRSLRPNISIERFVERITPPRSSEFPLTVVPEVKRLLPQLRGNPYTITLIYWGTEDLESRLQSLVRFTY